MYADGSNGSVELAGESIIIRRKGFANVLTQGIQGDKQIPLKSITAVQFRPAGSMMAGLIQFTLLGGREFRGGMLEATKDENAVMFTREQEPAFLALHDCIQQWISNPNPQTSAINATEDLERLAALHEKGHLTPEEFAEAKERILEGVAVARPAPSPQVLLRTAPNDVPAAVGRPEEKQGCLKTTGIVVLVLIGVLFLIGLAVPASKTRQTGSEAQASQASPVNQPLPEFTLVPAFSGLPGVAKSDFVGGRTRLLHIWASWCGPCVAEAPQLDALKAEGVEIIGIAISDRPEDVASFLSRYGNPYTRIGNDSISEVPLAVGSSGVPETFVIDAKGVIRYQHIGYIRSDDVSRILAEVDLVR